MRRKTFARATTLAAIATLMVAGSASAAIIVSPNETNSSGSINWGGAVVRGAYESLVTTVTVPNSYGTTCGSFAPNYTAEWLGFGGYDNSNLEAVGLLASCTSPYPAPPTYSIYEEEYQDGTFSSMMSVSGGDLVTMEIWDYGNSDVQFYAYDWTSKTSFTQEINCPNGCSNDTAEWVTSRVTDGTHLDPLAYVATPGSAGNYYAPCQGALFNNDWASTTAHPLGGSPLENLSPTYFDLYGLTTQDIVPYPVGNIVSTNCNANSNGFYDWQFYNS